MWQMESRINDGCFDAGAEAYFFFVRGTFDGKGTSRAQQKRFVYRFDMKERDAKGSSVE